MRSTVARVTRITSYNVCYTKLLRSYHHIRRERPHLISHIENFDQFIRWKLNPERPYQYHIDTSIQSQLDYLIDLQGKIIVDFIGRVITSYSIHYTKLYDRAVYVRSDELSLALASLGIVHHFEVHTLQPLIQRHQLALIIDYQRRGLIDHFIPISRNSARALIDAGADERRIHISPSSYNFV